MCHERNQMSTLWLRVLLSGSLLLSATSAGWASQVGRILIRSAIGPSTAEYIGRAIGLSTRRGDACLIVELDTPGGLLESTKEIVQKFYASEIPLIVYVTPSGANAASAGCFITLAADVAAMAPNTSIGAAHPVSMGPGGAEKTDDVMKQKLENYAGSYIEAIAQKRGRNVEWARSSVTTSESITAEKALELKVIDIVSPDLKDLLRQLDQRQVRGTSLNLAAATISHIPMLPRERLFQMLWRPEVMLILMLAAVYGLIGELSNPGAILPGVVGAIALILALNMMAILPINMAGVALILLAVILFGIDLFAPTHGVLTFGGIVSFFLGALMLFERGSGLRISLAFLIPITLLTALFFLFVAGAGLRAQRLPVRSGPETMLGQIVPALNRIDPSGGRVFIEGEHWNATSETPIEQGATVLVEGFNGLTLKVRPATPAKI